MAFYVADNVAGEPQLHGAENLSSFERHNVSRFKLTSPGALLILAVLSAGGIFLLDLFYLQPYLESQKEAAFREQAARAEGATMQGLRTLEDGLRNSCAAWSQNPRTLTLADARVPHRQAHEFARRVLESAGADMLWLTDETGTVIGAWSDGSFDTDKPVRENLRNKITQSLAGAGGTGKIVPPMGLLNISGTPVIYGRKSLQLSSGASKVIGHLWLGRQLAGRSYHNIASGLVSRLVLIPGGQPPSKNIRLSRDGILVVAWPVADTLGSPLGYFRAELPMGHIVRQAATARRMILIILSLSVGLVLLIILGSHMLVTGPVIRLLHRLQELETGEGKAEDLARNLHGEPLVLARRLELAFDKLAHMSKTDQLTGLANRRRFTEVLECFYVQARRYNRPMSLITMDIDFFKAVNDTGGHQVGDELLKIVAAAIEKACRKADLPARLGGDEFAILLPETSAAEAAFVAERVLQVTSESAVANETIKLIVTLSIGITDLNAGEIDSPEAMMSLADKALYAAKELGRNRIVQAHDLTGINWRGRNREGVKVDVLCKKLAGLDVRFKDLFLQAIEEIAVILEQRDPHMADHTRKVQHYAALIAAEIELPERVIKHIEIAASLHDIGMIALPDSVLLCPGPLDEEQLEIMRKHTLLGVRMMEGMEFLEQEIPAVRYHHERYDGKGYPEGISGASIPLTARILAVADSFDAITSPRTFRPAKSQGRALEEIKHAAGTQFDPAIVEAFLAVAERLGDKLMDVPGAKKFTLPDEVVSQELASRS